MPCTPVLQFENVSYAYPSGTNAPPQPALQNVSFAVQRGEFVALLGHNGSGKSTVAKLCNGLLAPTQGRVLVGEHCTANETDLLAIRALVGLVFQNPDNQLVAATLEDDTAFGPENLCVPPAVIRQRVDAALEAVGLAGMQQAEPHKLSGGQKQRAAIAGVLAMQTDVLVLDEATAMLDPQGRREVLGTVHRLHREQGLTVLLITHFMEEALQADRVLLLHQGHLLQEGKPQAVFAQPSALQRAGLELPAAAQLAAQLRQVLPNLPASLLTEADLIAGLWEALHGAA